jgi:hypothetical protein
MKVLFACIFVGGHSYRERAILHDPIEKGGLEDGRLWLFGCMFSQFLLQKERCEVTNCRLSRGACVVDLFVRLVRFANIVPTFGVQARF